MSFGHSLLVTQVAVCFYCSDAEDLEEVNPKRLLLARVCSFALIYPCKTIGADLNLSAPCWVVGLITLHMTNENLALSGVCACPCQSTVPGHHIPKLSYTKEIEVRLINTSD